MKARIQTAVMCLAMTMASVIPPVHADGEGVLAATVLGQDIYATDPGEVQSAILSRMFDRYAQVNGIEAQESEIETFVENMRKGMAERGLTADEDLTEEEAKEVAAMRRQMGASMIRQWKLNKALYEQYGGRLIYQQLGPEPLDAYLTYLEERQKAGDFTIEDPEAKKLFWDYFTDEQKHEFIPAGSEDEVGAFAVPPWEG